MSLRRPVLRAAASGQARGAAVEWQADPVGTSSAVVDRAIIQVSAPPSTSP
jgi:hypothetical protein